MVDISTKTYERNGIETIVNNDGILWLRVKHIEEGLDHKYLWEITIKYHSNHKKDRYELVGEPKKEVNRIFIDEKLAIKVIMDCRTTYSHNFRTRLVFQQYDVILTKEQQLVTKTISSFKGEDMQAKYNVLNYRTYIFMNINKQYKLMKMDTVREILTMK